MGWVYNHKDAIDATHYCLRELPPVRATDEHGHTDYEATRRMALLGSVYQCDTCGRYWHVTLSSSYGPPRWALVRWWNFSARRHIRTQKDTP